MIIVYHRLKDAPCCCPIKRFEQEVKLAKKYGFKLTFDDGLKEHITIALPILKKYKMKAIFFPITSKKVFPGVRWIGQEFMTWDNIKELHENGMEIGCHTHTHPRLSRLSKTDQEIEIKTSTRIITRKIEKPVWFSYPYSSFNNATVSLIKKYGYLYGLTSEEPDYLRLKRTDTNEFNIWCKDKIER